MKKDLREFLDHTSALAETFWDTDGSQLAYYVAEDTEGLFSVFACMMSGAEEETAFRKVLPQLLRGKGYVRWCFFTEAWCAPDNGVLPKDNPNRTEVVVFAAEEARTGQRMGATRQIVRADDGKLRLLPLVPDNVAFVMGG